jgi:hypothetical protein
VIGHGNRCPGLDRVAIFGYFRLFHAIFLNFICLISNFLAIWSHIFMIEVSK